MRTAATGVLCVLAIATTAAFAASPPGVINYQGVLRDDVDKPVEDGSYAMTFSFFDVQVGGDAILLDEQDSVPVSGGLFNATLGLESNVSDGSGPGTYATLEQVFGDFSQLYLEVEVNGETLAPRMSLASSGYALNSRLVRGIEIATDGPLSLYVDDSGDDANTGLDPAAPKQTIQAAVDAIPPVLTDDVTIFIGGGTYNERVAIFPRVRTGVHWLRLQGNESFPQTVVLDGTGLPPAGEDAPDSGLFVYDLPVEISGITVQNFASSAISVEFSSYLVLRDCRVVDNLEPYEAAVQAFQGASVEVWSCLISNNCVGISASDGGRIGVHELVDISNNGADPACGNTESPRGVEARSGGAIGFEVPNAGDCSLSNNDLYPWDHSTISNWDGCALVNSTCVEDPSDPTSVCRPDPGP